MATHGALVTSLRRRLLEKDKVKLEACTHNHRGYSRSPLEILLLEVNDDSAL